MAKGFRPTDDPDWRHDHVATGETRRCARKRCKVTWAVLCHNGSRIYCDTCARAVKRERDRADKQRIRKQARRNTDHSRAYLAVMLPGQKQSTAPFLTWMRTRKTSLGSSSWPSRSPGYSGHLTSPGRLTTPRASGDLRASYALRLTRPLSA